MKKRFITTLVFLISTITILMAQAPEQMSYQAIVRDSQGQLVANQSLSATVKVRVGSTDIFNQTYHVNTNAHGLLTLNFGDPVFMSINWENATISCEVKQGGTIYMAENFQPVVAVPLSLYATSMNRDTLHSYLDRDSNILYIRHYMEQNRTYIIYNDMIIHQALEDTAANIRRDINIIDSAIRSALVDTARAIRSALVDSASDIRTFIGVREAAVRSALVDTADNIRTDMGVMDAAIRSALVDTAADLRNAINMPEKQTLDSVLTLDNDAGAKQIKNLQDPTDPQDAVTKKVLNESIQLRVSYAGDTLYLGSSQWVLIPGISAEMYYPKVTTNIISNMTSTNANGGGNVTTQGDNAVIARGVCWSTSPNPTLSNSYTVDGIGLGVFASSITGLTSNTTYYVRAYATNSAGTGYGNDIVFRTFPPCLPVTDVDGNTYQVLQLGSQCWMRENLRVTKYTTGTNIELGDSLSNSIPYRYYPNGDINNVSTYGYLYNWAAVMKGAGSSSSNPSGVQGICPNGWHLPSIAEWTQLTDYVSSQPSYLCYSDTGSHIAKALVSTTGWEILSWYSGTCVIGDTTDTNNATGFNAFPAGEAGNYFLDLYNNIGYGVRFWSTTEDNDAPEKAYFLDMYYSRANVLNITRDKSWGYSVRCLRDN